VPSDREWQALEDIRDNILRVQRFVSGFDLAAFEADERTHFAVIRCLEIVSEASRAVGEDVKHRQDHLPWKRIADAGNVYRHVYSAVRLEIVWETVHAALPALLVAVETELEGSFPPREGP
jgi:uncharacterized protein with HEPN domain